MMLDFFLHGKIYIEMTRMMEDKEYNRYNQSRFTAKEIKKKKDQSCNSHHTFPLI